MTVSNIRPDDATTLGMVMRAVARLTDAQLNTDAKVDRLSAQIDRVASQNRDFYERKLRPIEDRLRIVEGDMEEITGVHNQRDLERAARTHRARAAEEELKRQRLVKLGKTIAPVLIVAGAAAWQAIQLVLAALGK